MEFNDYSELTDELYKAYSRMYEQCLQHILTQLGVDYTNLEEVKEFCTKHPVTRETIKRATINDNEEVEKITCAGRTFKITSTIKGMKVVEITKENI